MHLRIYVYVDGSVYACMHAYIHTSDHPCIFGTCTPGAQASIRTYIHTYIHYTCLRFPLQLCALNPDCYIVEESAMGPDAWKHGYGAQTASYHPIVRYGNTGQRSSAMLPLCQYLYHKMATTVSIITIVVTIRSKAHHDCKPFAELRVCQPLTKHSQNLCRPAIEPL